MILKDTDELIRLTNTPAADIDVLVCYVDLTVSGGAIDAGSTPNKYTTTQTNATILGSPASGVRRKVKYINVTNIDSADSTDVTINYYDGSTSVEQLRTVTLAPQESLVYADGTWFVYDENGGVKTDAALASDTLAGRIEVADQTEMEAGSATDRAVTPGRQHFHTSAAKFWAQVENATAATPVLGVDYNVDSMTDTNVGRVLITITNDFSSTEWVCQTTNLTTTTTGDEGISNVATIAAGSIEIQNRIITPAFADPPNGGGYYVVGYGDL